MSYYALATRSESAPFAVRSEIPAKMVPLLAHKTFKIMHGGRSSAKSTTTAQILIGKAMSGTLRILCCREVQKSIKSSVMQLLWDCIQAKGLGPYFDKTLTEITCKLTGTVFLFTGLKDHTVDTIKSFEGIDIAWVEEAHKVSANSWNILIPTILRNEGAEIWATFNPDQEEDYVYSRFVIGDDPEAIVIEVNWSDNPWWNKTLEIERLRLKAVNEDLYQHIYEGALRSAAGIMFKRDKFHRFDLGQEPKRLNKYMASDYAGAPDPDDPEADPDFTEHGVVGLDDDGQWWFVDWWSGQEDPAVYIEAGHAMAIKHKTIRAFEEKGAILRTIDGYIRKALRDSGKYYVREGLASVASKADRMLAFAAVVANGDVHVPRTPWGDRFINQLCAFTGQDGRVDDMADVGSLLARGLENMHDARKPDKPKPSGPAPFTDAWYDAKDRANEDAQRRRGRSEL